MKPLRACLRVADVTAAVAIAFAIAVFVPVGSASATSTDDMRCRRVDASRVASIVVDLDTIFGVDAGCRVHGRARELCEPAYAADSSTGQARGAPAPTPASRHLCFRVRCPQRPLPVIGVADRFGTRPVALQVPTRVCLPVKLDAEVD